MSLDDKLYILFERTLQSNESEVLNLQRIIQNQAQIISKKPKKENMGPVSVSVTSIQKKLQAIEKNFMNQEPMSKRRHSRYEYRSKTNSICESHRRTPTQPCEDLAPCNEVSEFYQDNDVAELKRENTLLKEKLAELQYQERENYLRIEGELDELRREKNNMIDIKRKYEEQEKSLQQRLNQLDQKEITLNNWHSNLIKQNKQLEGEKQEQKYIDNSLNQRRETIEQIQNQLNLSIQQLFCLNKNELKTKVQTQLGVQLEAVEQLVTSTFKERQMIQTEQMYLRQLKQAIQEEKQDLLKLKQ